ncbi:MAG: class I SAM-dependent methyltransferase [Vampirovibrio sp.]|nr:class I SAM-dependent methyltransferase [Vampirovibrio sp.]
MPFQSALSTTKSSCASFRFAGKPSLQGLLEQNAKLWDGNASVWNAAEESQKDLYRQYFLAPTIQKFVGSVANKNVLDMGCGEGIFCRQFAKNAKSVTGIDISEKMLAIANKKPTNGIQYLKRSITDLSNLKNEQFDTVFSSMTFMSSPGLPQSISEAYRLLKPGGEFMFIIKHPFNLWKQHQKTNGKQISYFNDNPFVYEADLTKYAKKVDEHVPTVKAKSIHYPRTISTYLNTLREAGFILEEMVEPEIPKATLKILGSQKHDWEMPQIMMVRAIKPKTSTIQ